ncbi:lipoprotein-releasing ABC transporter ATP-binding protein LolD [Pseudoalteromonas sp. T1lg75]|uniref:lipoprotein-releasing ABC transporter ATP-binding protein LolD n=1 Tax=Pseudoalteromonas sp. T1lg75 TaxID=2077102 RepID=UPI000CF684DD|nr:lipoprotein-releasing ABC transporter ATP-binding protein LolD [Pseudoalteromonas sp. T1lg75]
MSSIVISCHKLTKVYSDAAEQIEVLKGVDLTVERGESVAIVGSSGSGKSTLLHILGTLDKPTSGNLVICETEVAKLSRKQQALFRNKHLGFIYQFHHLLMEFTALENVAMPLLIAGMDAKQAEQKAKVMLGKVGLSHRADHKPAKLSGGERQRVAIARAVVSEPDLVLADEPTGNLDKHNAQRIFALLMELQQDLGTSFVVVTHDLDLASRLTRTVVLDEGLLSPQHTEVDTL